MRVFLLGLLAIGCGDRIVTFELPPFEDARSAVFAFHGPEQFEARAVDLRSGEVAVAFPVDLDEDAEGRIEALAFDALLADLGLSPGTIVSAPEGVPLPGEDELFVAGFRGVDAGAWSSSDRRSPEVDDLRIAIDLECTELAQVASFTLDTAADHTFALSLGPSRALIASEDGEAWVVDPNGAVPVTDISAGLPLDDVLELDDGSLLFAGALGQVWSGRIVTSTLGSPVRIEGELSTTIPSGEEIVRFDGGREDGTLELFAIGEDGGFYRYDGATWEKLHDFGVDVNTASAVIRPRPGLAYAGADEKAEVVRYQAGVLVPFSPPDLVNGVPGMAYFDELGLVMSRSEGGIYRLRDEESWELLEGSPISLNVYSFRWLGGGFLFGGAFGFVSEYRLGLGYCPAVQLGAGSVRSITPFADGFLLGQDKPMSRDQVQVTIVRRAD